MKQILISPNTSNKDAINIIVTDKDFSIIQEFKHYGEFKRFDLQLYDEGKHLKVSDGVEVFKEWFCKNMFIGDLWVVETVWQKLAANKKQTKKI